MGEQILQVTADGRFVWHDNADELIEEGDFRSSPAVQHILRRLRRASAVEAAAQQALEALENAEDQLAKPYSTDASKAAVALRAALAEDALDRLSENERALGIQMEVSRAALTQEQAEPVATMTECEACFTPDVCQLRGTCDHYAASQLRVAAQPKPPAEPMQEPVGTKALTHDAIADALSRGASLSEDQRAVLLGLVADDKVWQRECDRLHAELAALRAALAQEQAEPVKEQDVEDAIEAAYWHFDARRSGLSEWASAPQSERDAFKAEARKLARGYFPTRQAQERAEPVCKCDPRTRLVGDGCEVCNPELAAELAQEQAEPVQEPVCRADGMPTSAEERHLRRLLALRAAMPHTYYDDGEAQGAEHGISIDFMREPVAHIDAKLRALNVARAIAKQAEPVQEPVWIQPDHLQKARIAPFLCRVEPTQRLSDFVALYTAPPKLLPLTDEEFDALCKANSFGAVARGQFPLIPRAMLKALVDAAVERAHGIGSQP